MKTRDGYLNHMLAEREDVLLITRQHWVVLTQALIPEIVLIIAIITMVVVGTLTDTAVTGFAMWGLLLIILPLISGLRDYLIWNNHKYIVTNRRVIQLFGLFNKNVTDSSLEKVNDVKMVQSILGRIFNYGDIEILTASELGMNRFTLLNDPVHFKTAMLNAKARLENGDRPNVPERKVPGQDIPNLLAQLGTLRSQNVISEEEFQRKKTELLQRM